MIDVGGYVCLEGYPNLVVPASVAGNRVLVPKGMAGAEGTADPKPCYMDMLTVLYDPWFMTEAVYEETGGDMAEHRSMGVLPRFIAAELYGAGRARFSSDQLPKA
ncbi:MAG: hypothetical protein GX595_09345 [Lentisphaerae bacterium]|nr:hypothetical protein [Lentisphaerota bacterium]